MNSSEKPHPRGPSVWFFALVGAAAFALLLGTYVRIWSPEYGITRFIIIGHEFNQRGLAVYRATPKYMEPYPPDRWGFDGQHYAQLALDPLLCDLQIKQAIDNPPYRARRILLPWLAWMGGLGHPFWVLNVYAALNLVFWIGFAVMMAKLFRPYDWAGLAGYAAILLTCGIIESMRRSLTDFPAFVLMTLAATMGGAAGAGMLGLATLAREVSLLGFVALAEFQPPWKEALKKNLKLGLIAAGPFLLWFGYMTWRLQMHARVDGDNMGWPMQAVGRKLGEFFLAARHGGVDWAQFYRSYPLHALLTIAAILTQCVYLLIHQEWNNRLWRLAIVFVPFFLCVGYPAWESHFTATRHALPITLGFNLILAMRPTRRWLWWFLLGNCFVPYGVFEFAFYGVRSTPAPEFAVVGPASAGQDVRSNFREGWFGAETNSQRTWRWAERERAAIVLSNKTTNHLTVELDFSTLSPVPRDLQVRVRDKMLWPGHHVSGTAIWSGEIDYALKSVRSAKFTLPPGDVIVTFSTSVPSSSRGADDPRQLSFMLADLRLVVSEAAASR